MYSWNVQSSGNFRLDYATRRINSLRAYMTWLFNIPYFDGNINRPWRTQQTWMFHHECLVSSHHFRWDYATYRTNFPRAHALWRFNPNTLCWENIYLVNGGNVRLIVKVVVLGEVKMCGSFTCCTNPYRWFFPRFINGVSNKGGLSFLEIFRCQNVRMRPNKGGTQGGRNSVIWIDVDTEDPKYYPASACLIVCIHWLVNLRLPGAIRTAL